MSLIAYLGWIVGGIGFVIGFAFIPVTAWGLGSAVPKPLAEPISKALLAVSLIATGESVLVQTESGEYDIVPAAEVDGEIHDAYLTRWNFVSFGIAFECSEEAFGDDVADVDPEGYVLESRFSFPATEVDINRGGIGSYIDLSKEGFRIPVGQKLAELRKTANLELATEAMSEAMKKYGGDSSKVKQSHSMGMFLVFTFTGLGMGWVLFF